MTGLGAGCPVGCGRDVDPGKLMCRDCWSQVPRDVQRRVYDTWRAYRARIGSPRRVGKTAARDAYIEARDAAIGSVR